MQPRPSRHASALLGLLVLAIGASPVFADAPEAPAPSRVSFEVTVAHALPEPGQIDPGCQRLHQRLPFSFGTIRMVKHQRFDLPMGELAVMTLPSGRQLSLLPIQVIKRRLHMQYEMQGVVNTRLRLTSGKPVILGGPRQREGQLIIEVMPSFESPTYVAEPEPPAPPEVERASANQ